MEFLIVIILIAVLSSLIGKSAKQTGRANSRTARPMPSRPAPAKTPSDDEDSALETVIREMKQDLGETASAFKQSAARGGSSAIEDAIAAFRAGFGSDDAEPEEGESVLDTDGCVGGSLGAHVEEGEPFLEHAEHLRRADAKAAQPRAQEASAILPNRISAAEMRRAVVMAEILDRPKALRRRG